MADCIFCQIASGDIPSDIVYSDDYVVAFRDLNPQAPTHVLVIPREHYSDMAEIAAHNPALAGHLMTGVSAVVAADGLTGGWRLVFNTGPDSGQTVFHVHGHVLGGRYLEWPPG